MDSGAVPEHPADTQARPGSLRRPELGSEQRQPRAGGRCRTEAGGRGPAVEPAHSPPNRHGIIQRDEFAEEPGIDPVVIQAGSAAHQPLVPFADVPEEAEAGAPFADIVVEFGVGDAGELLPFLVQTHLAIVQELELITEPEGDIEAACGRPGVLQVCRELPALELRRRRATLGDAEDTFLPPQLVDACERVETALGVHVALLEVVVR